MRRSEVGSGMPCTCQEAPSADTPSQKLAHSSPSIVSPKPPQRYLPTIFDLVGNPLDSDIARSYFWPQIYAVSHRTLSVARPRICTISFSPSEIGH